MFNFVVLGINCLDRVVVGGVLVLDELKCKWICWIKLKNMVNLILGVDVDYIIIYMYGI